MKWIERYERAAGSSPNSLAFAPILAGLMVALWTCACVPAVAQVPTAAEELPEAGLVAPSAGAVASSARAEVLPAGSDAGQKLSGIDFQKESTSGPVARLALGSGDRMEPVQSRRPERATPESNLVFEGLASYGHYRLFASGSDCKLYTAGVEYDRNSWGRLLGARWDYVAEFLPVVLLKAPVTQDIWGSPTSQQKHIVPGIGFSPFGFRMLWRDNKSLKPYLLAKGGVLVFTEKALSQRATYENFSLQSSTGVNVRVNERFDVRVGLYSDFHFSNGFIVPVNPGLDVMNVNVGLSYRLGK